MSENQPTTGWQPIKTAPRDGTWFVICRAGEPDSCEVGCLEELTWHEYVEVGDGLYKKVSKPTLDWSGFNNMHRATHWISLPEVPNE